MIGEVSADILANAKAVRKVILCTGRVYYDLAKRRSAENRNDVALVRMERLYPVPAEEVQQALAPFPNAELVWVQDEPENQGAWPFMVSNLFPVLGYVSLANLLGALTASDLPGIPTVSVVAREAAASPATGIQWRHTEEQGDLLTRALS